MRLIISAIVCVASVNFLGCAHPSAPRPPPMQECDLIAVEGGEPYLRCKWSTGGDAWRIKIKNLPARKEKYLCTDDKSYANAWVYGEALDRWINQHCK